MTPLRATAITTACAITSFTCMAFLPVAGYDTTTALWLTYAGLATGLTAIVTATITIAALTPITRPHTPQEPAQAPLRLTVVRDQLPVVTRPTKGAIELPAAR